MRYAILFLLLAGCKADMSDPPLTLYRVVNSETGNTIEDGFGSEDAAQAYIDWWKAERLRRNAAATEDAQQGWPKDDSPMKPGESRVVLAAEYIFDLDLEVKPYRLE